MKTLAKIIGAGALAAAVVVPTFAFASHRDDERALQMFGAVVGTIARAAAHDRYHRSYYYSPYGGYPAYEYDYYYEPSYAPPPPVYYRTRPGSRSDCRNMPGYDPQTRSHDDGTGGRVYC